MRVVNPVTPGLGGPQVIRRRDGSQGPAHAFRGSNGHLVSAKVKQLQNREKAKCDQFFSSTLGVRIGNRMERLVNSGRSGGDRLICEGFDPGSE